jgi:uncharacterized protein YecT (DUF1311 family)
MNRPNSFFGAALACLLVLDVSLVAAAQQQPVVIVAGPTIVAFFPVTKAELQNNADTGEALADFQLYAKQVREPLKKAGIDFSEVYSHSFRIRIGQEATVFRPTKDDAGYYLIVPGKKPRIEYGVMTDSDLLQVAREYFGTTPEHSWDVFMDAPEAKDAASKLLGHCGDAETQDVMNACFALEFENANAQMNSALEAMLKQLEANERSGVQAAQRAWSQYRDLHCEAVGTIRVGGGSLEPTEVAICKANLTRARTKEINDSYHALEER